MTAEINLELEPDILTDKEPNKTLPCRQCGRPCVVTVFASPMKTECSFCRQGLTPKAGVTVAGEEMVVKGPELEFDESLETEVLTDRDKTKTVPCRKCRRPCVVTTFATASKVECNTCRGVKDREHKEAVQIKAAHTVDPATLENLVDALINPAFKQIPLCPFDQEHTLLLVNVVHSPNYGPRHLAGYNSKGMPVYEQEAGESVTYQCQECRTTVNFSTMHPLLLVPQNVARATSKSGPSVLELQLGVREEAA